jgi:hypothetical protein
MQHERLHPFNTRDVYPHQTLDNDMSMVVKAGNRLFMRGQTGLDRTHRLVARRMPPTRPPRPCAMSRSCSRKQDRASNITYLQSDDLYY